MENRPVTISIKNFLVRKLAVDMMVIPEKTIEAIINHQFSSALNAVNTKNSIEISGMGRFVFSTRRAELFLKKLMIYKECCQGDIDNEELSKKKRENAGARMKVLDDNIKYLKTKLRED